MTESRPSFLNIVPTRTWQKLGRLVGYLIGIACLVALLVFASPARSFHDPDPVMDCAADLRTLAIWAALRDEGVSKVDAIPLIAPTEENLTDLGLTAKQKDTVRLYTRLGIQLVWEEGLKDEALFDNWMERCTALRESI